MKTIQALLSLFIAASFVFGSPKPTVASSTAPANPIVIVAFGDSLTAGYGLTNDKAFPTKLAQALTSRGHKVKIHNAGVSGDTSTSGLSRLSWSLPANTDGVILELGANDALRGVNPDQTRSALNQILQKLAKQNIPVLLTGMRAPPNMGPAYEQKFNTIFPDLAKSHDVGFYPFFLDGVAANLALNQPDGIHPNMRGVDVIVEKIIPFVEQLITRIKQDRKS